MNSKENIGIPEKGQVRKITKERLGEIQTLEIGVEADFSKILEELKNRTGVDLQPREGGYHLTIINPNESKILSTLDDEKVAELENINEKIQKGDGITVNGIGFIDGASEKYKMREADKVKKTAFISFDIPALQEFRAKIGLPPKDFHITLGFVGGDIHSHVIGQQPVKLGSPKMKDIIEPIPKKADESFSDIELPKLRYTEFDGQNK